MREGGGDRCRESVGKRNTGEEQYSEHELARWCLCVHGKSKEK